MIKRLIVVLVMLMTATLTAAQYDPPPVADCPAEILFVSDREGNPDIFLMNANGTNVRNLTNDSASDYAARWSPDGSQVVFASERDGAADIYVMDADGGNVQRLTFNSDFEDSFPIWSQDGTQIAWTTFEFGGGDVYIMNADGSNPRPLVETPGLEFASAWSPDNSLFAYESEGGGDFEIYVMPDIANPDDVIAVTDSTSQDFGMVWSPDGKMVAFNYGLTAGSAIYVMLAETYDANVDQLREVSDQANNATVPSWSPTGTQIVFGSSNGITDDVYIVNADGTDLVNVTDSTASHDYYPAWRPCP